MSGIQNQFVEIKAQKEGLENILIAIFAVKTLLEREVLKVENQEVLKNNLESRTADLLSQMERIDPEYQLDEQILTGTTNHLITTLASTITQINLSNIAGEQNEKALLRSFEEYFSLPSTQLIIANPIVLIALSLKFGIKTDPQIKTKIFSQFIDDRIAIDQSGIDEYEKGIEENFRQVGKLLIMNREKLLEYLLKYVEFLDNRFLEIMLLLMTNSLDFESKTAIELLQTIQMINEEINKDFAMQHIDISKSFAMNLKDGIEIRKDYYELIINCLRLSKLVEADVISSLEVRFNKDLDDQKEVLDDI
jgi:hypothetical protein